MAAITGTRPTYAPFVINPDIRPYARAGLSNLNDPDIQARDEARATLPFWIYCDDLVSWDRTWRDLEKKCRINPISREQSLVQMYRADRITDAQTELIEELVSETELLRIIGPIELRQFTPREADYLIRFIQSERHLDP